MALALAAAPFAARIARILSSCCATQDHNISPQRQARYRSVEARHLSWRYAWAEEMVAESKAL